MWEQIRANKRRSLILISAMALTLIGLGMAISIFFAPQHFWVGGVIACAVFVLLWLVAVAGGSELVLASAGARKIEHADMPRLFNVVEEMTIAAALPKMPKVYLIDCDAPNAFACGTPENSAVAVTSGLLMRLTRDELQGVVAHEIAHVKNEDSKFLTLAGVMMGAIILIADGFLRGLFYSGAGRRRSSSRDSGGGQVQAILMIVAIVFAILAPILAQLLYFACSRRREYLADACAARFTRYPAGLASALDKISRNAEKMADVNRVTAPMYIINPLKGSAVAGAFSTHPPTAERVRILRSMAGGAGLAEYEASYKTVCGGSSVIGAQSLSEADTAELRAANPDAEEADLAKAREVVDIFHKMGGLLFLQCVCGLKMKVPPAYNRPTVACPRCKRQHTVPPVAQRTQGKKTATS